MIEIAKLKSMLDAEMEMAAAWKDMTQRERTAYIKAHPNSRYNNGAKGGAPKSNLSGHFAKHGFKKSGNGMYTHANGRKIQVVKSSKGKKFAIKVHHANGDHTVHHRNNANNIGALIHHWSKAGKKGTYKKRAYKAGTVRKHKYDEKNFPKEKYSRTSDKTGVKSYKKAPEAKKRGRPPMKKAEAPAEPAKKASRGTSIKDMKKSELKRFAEHKGRLAKLSQQKHPAVKAKVPAEKPAKKEARKASREADW